MTKTILILLLSLVLGTSPLFAVEITPNPEETEGVQYLKWPAYDGMKQEVLRIVNGTSESLRLDRPVIRAAISDPTICDIATLNRQEILINAKKTGRVNLMVWDEQNHIASYGIQSTVDLPQLERILQGLDSKAKFDLYPVNNSVVVQGSTDTVLKAKKLEQAITAFDPKATSLVQVEKPKQILLEVRFAEVNRKAASDFGLDTQVIVDKWSESSFFGRNSPKSDNNERSSDKNTFFPNGSAVGIPFLPVPDSTGKTDMLLTYGQDNLWVANYLQWLVQQNILKIIARPNLLAKDGEAAKFLVGGEFPVPIETENRIQVDYREFGTKLEFKPEVLDGSALRLKVLTEVSELDFSTTVSFRASTFPMILKRTQETVAELRDGETLVIGGMITQRVNHVNKKFPILGDIPLIKSAFRKDEFARTDVELLVVITPHLVSPFDMREKKVFFDDAGVDRIKNASRVFSPAYGDEQGDAINEVFTQGESVQDFNKPGKILERPKLTKKEIEDKIQVNVQVDIQDQANAAKPKQVQP